MSAWLIAKHSRPYRRRNNSCANTSCVVHSIYFPLLVIPSLRWSFTVAFVAVLAVFFFFLIILNHFFCRSLFTTLALFEFFKQRIDITVKRKYEKYEHTGIITGRRKKMNQWQKQRDGQRWWKREVNNNNSRRIRNHNSTLGTTCACIYFFPIFIFNFSTAHSNTATNERAAVVAVVVVIIVVVIYTVSSDRSDSKTQKKNE